VQLPEALDILITGDGYRSLLHRPQYTGRHAWPLAGDARELIRVADAPDRRAPARGVGLAAPKRTGGPGGLGRLNSQLPWYELKVHVVHLVSRSAPVVAFAVFMAFQSYLAIEGWGTRSAPTLSIITATAVASLLLLWMTLRWSRGRAVRLLLVENNLRLQQLLAGLLRRAGYELDAVGFGG
jgi:hypothetical protein